MPFSVFSSIDNSVRNKKRIVNTSIFTFNSITPDLNGPYPVVSTQSIDNYGTSTTDGVTYNVYTFTNNSSTSKPVSSYVINYTLSTQTLIYVLAVGGGGGGVGGGGGGGGSGGGVVMTPVLLPSGTNQSITISIGAGGEAGSNGNDTTVQFSAISTSNITALKGVIGGNGTNATQVSSSTGGGGFSAGTSPTPSYLNRNYGNIGGVGSSTTGGGGGGAGICGKNGTVGGNGGNGIQCFLPGIKNYLITSNKYSYPGIAVSTLYWGGGGGGGVGISSAANAGSGGLGGGGSGNSNGPTTANGGVGLNDGGKGVINGASGAGGINTGGGGGGTWTTGTNSGGGSGIVIIAFPQTVVTTSTSSILTNASFSATAYSSIRAVYGCKLLNYNYFGPIFTLRYSTDTTGYYTKNFYIDTTGNNIGDQYLGTGTSLSSWLTANNANTTYAFITKWYDQGMDVSFNSAVQNTTNIQPIYELSNKILNFGFTGAPQTNCFFTLNNGTIPYTGSYTVALKHGAMSNGIGGFCGGGTNASGSRSNNFRRNNDTYVNYWWGNDFISSSGVFNSAGNILCWIYNTSTTNTALYLNGSTTNSGSKNRTGWNCTNNNGFIGRTTNGTSECINGKLEFLYLFNSVLSNQDRSLLGI